MWLQLLIFKSYMWSNFSSQYHFDIYCTTFYGSLSINCVVLIFTWIYTKLQIIILICDLRFSKIEKLALRCAPREWNTVEPLNSEYRLLLKKVSTIKRFHWTDHALRQKTQTCPSKYPKCMSILHVNPT